MEDFMFLTNPFGTEGKWYKGNLHTHTTNSDGAWSPEKVASEYRSNGYDFLFITDHWKVTDVSGLSTDGFLALNGEELDIGPSELGYHYHIVALNLKEPIASNSASNAQELINLIKSKGAEAVIAHPYWSGLTANDIQPLEGQIGVEIFNSTCFFCIAKGHSVVHWDELLCKGKLMWGIAVDDTHQHFDDHRPIDACNAWIMAKMTELTEDNVMSAIKSGNFYSSNGPMINDISIQDGIISVTTSDVKIINFIANAHNGESFTSKDGKPITSAKYKIRGGEKYIRVECFDENGKTAWSNPLLVNL
jgi:hypothetical protein